MGMNFTPEQQKVIELHNSNILVSAAACLEAVRRRYW